MNRRNSSAFLSEYRSRKVYKYPVLYPPDFFWCKCHPDAHPLPFQNLSPYIFLLHQLEHFLPPSHDGLPTRKDETCYSFIRLSWKLSKCLKKNWPRMLGTFAGRNICQTFWRDLWRDLCLCLTLVEYGLKYQIRNWTRYWQYEWMNNLSGWKSTG